MRTHVLTGTNGHTSMYTQIKEVEARMRNELERSKQLMQAVQELELDIMIEARSVLPADLSLTHAGSFGRSSTTETVTGMMN